ncbi:MAG TPA: hypothetical protein VK190_02815 [Pseudoneobacillus sp.]|nr:hypothetical protein [Pseudoneobacillus sp.]
MAYSPVEYNLTFDPSYEMDPRELAHRLNRTYRTWQPVNRMERTLFVRPEEYVANKLKGQDINRHVKEVLMSDMSKDVINYLSEHPGTIPTFELNVRVPEEEIHYHNDEYSHIKDDKVRFTLAVTFLAMCDSIPMPKIEFDFDKCYYKYL